MQPAKELRYLNWMGYLVDLPVVIAEPVAVLSKKTNPIYPRENIPQHR